MKKINYLTLGFTFAGSFLGAGFVSGQEIWQFFGSFGIMGIFGIALAFLLHFLFGVIIIRLVHNTGIVDMDKLVVWRDIPWLRAFVGAVTTVFMFSIIVIMSAGAGALLNRMFNIPQYVGSGLFCFAVAVATLGGVKGMVDALSRLVPFMILCAVAIGVFSVIKSDFNFTFESVNDNVLMNNWFFSAITYTSHNLFCTIGILSPVALLVDEKTVSRGVGLGSIIMFLIALSVMLGICSDISVAETQLPMLELGYDINSFVGVLYALSLIFSMFGTSLSSIVGVAEYGEQKSLWFKKFKKPLVFSMCIVGWLCSLFGFGDLIGIIYPISGYFGFGAILAVAIHWFISRQIPLKK